MRSSHRSSKSTTRQPSLTNSSDNLHRLHLRQRCPLPRQFLHHPHNLNTRFLKLQLRPAKSSLLVTSWHNITAPLSPRAPPPAILSPTTTSPTHPRIHKLIVPPPCAAPTRLRPPPLPQPQRRRPHPQPHIRAPASPARPVHDSRRKAPSRSVPASRTQREPGT
jgi:hypothetical protein